MAAAHDLTALSAWPAAQAWLRLHELQPNGASPGRARRPVSEEQLAAIAADRAAHPAKYAFFQLFECRGGDATAADR